MKIKLNNVPRCCLNCEGHGSQEEMRNDPISTVYMCCLGTVYEYWKKGKQYTFANPSRVMCIKKEIAGE